MCLDFMQSLPRHIWKTSGPTLGVAISSTQAPLELAGRGTDHQTDMCATANTTAMPMLIVTSILLVILLSLNAWHYFSVGACVRQLIARRRPATPLSSIRTPVPTHSPPRYARSFSVPSRYTTSPRRLEDVYDEPIYAVATFPRPSFSPPPAGISMMFFFHSL